MKLEKFNKNKKRNRIVIISVIGILLIIGSITLLRTFAFYESKKEFNVLQGQIPSHWYDMDVLSVVVDGKEQSEIPARGLYKVSADCGETKGEWDYNAWSLNLSNLKENTRCNVTFTSNGLNKLEYKQYIEAGKALRRNTYRGKILSGTYKETIDGEEVVIVGEYTLEQVYAMISDGTFSDIYVGDVIVSNGITWLVADIDNYLYSGTQDKVLDKHHLTIIPAIPLMDMGMNEGNTSAGGYVKTRMAQKTLPSLVADDGVIGKAFGGHIIEYRNLLSYTINAEAINQSGKTYVGASNDWGWYTRKIDLMSEINVYGSTVWGNGYDTGIDNRQYAIFQLKPEFIGSYANNRFSYWLKSVSSAETFARAGSDSGAGHWVASDANGVRPKFLIG